MHITGIDIGGSHITAGLIHPATGTLSSGLLIRRKVDCHADAETLLSQWCDAIRETWALEQLTQSPLAFAMPGPFDYTGGICLIKGFGKYEALYGLNIRAELSQRLNIEPEWILFRNDAEAFLEGERKAGAAKGFRHAIGLTLGTGMGSAKSHDGITTDAEMSFKVQVKDASIEEQISTRGILKSYFDLTGIGLRDAQSVAERAATDIHAQKSFAVFAHALTGLLQQFISEEQPDVVVIGGNIAKAWDLFMPDVLQQLAARLPAMPVVVKAALGETAAIIGATALFGTHQFPLS
jgi:glucokinase